MSGAVLRAKMEVIAVEQSTDGDGVITQERVNLTAVYAADGPNAKWTKWTPSADFEIWIDNPPAMGKLPLGNEFYVDFIPAGREDE